MSKYIGRKVAVGVGRETSRGTPVAAGHWMPQTDFSFDDKVEKFIIESAVNRIESPQETAFVSKWGEGALSGEVRSNALGLLLYAAFGTCNTTGPTDSAYTHAFSVAQTAQHQSLTFTVVDPNTTERYSLAMLDSLEFAIDTTNILSYTANFMSRTSKGSSATPSFVTDSKFVKKHLSFKLAADVGSLAAATPLSLKSLNFTIGKNVTRDEVLGTAEPEDFLNQTMTFEGSFTLNYEDETYKNYMRDNSFRAMEILFTNSDVVIGAGATRPSFKIQLHQADFFDWEPDNSLNEIVPQSVSFRGHFDLDTGEMFEAVELVNGTSSY